MDRYDSCVNRWNWYSQEEVLGFVLQYRDGEMKRENVLFVTSHSEACLSGLTSAHATQSCHGNCRLRRRKCKTEDMN